MTGTIDGDGTTTLRFYQLPDPSLGQQQEAVGTASLGSDGRLSGIVTVVKGPDLNDTFSFVLDPQSAAAAPSTVPKSWAGALTVARGGTDLLTVTISPQWTVFGTCTRVGEKQPGFMAGTIGTDFTTTLRFFGMPAPPVAQQQGTVGTISLGTDGSLRGLVTVVQGADLKDTFSFVLERQQ